MEEDKRLAIFKGKKIRRTIYKNEWWFVIEDVVFALTDSAQPKGYIKDMRRRDPELAKGWVQIGINLQAKHFMQEKCYNYPLAKPQNRYLTLLV